MRAQPPMRTERQQHLRLASGRRPDQQAFDLESLARFRPFAWRSGGRKNR
jgi:hypothetical protein